MSYRVSIHLRLTGEWLPLEASFPSPGEARRHGQMMQALHQGSVSEYRVEVTR